MMVLRGTKKIYVNNFQLIPGDIFPLTTDLKINCDCILTGGVVLVDEVIFILIPPHLLNSNLFNIIYFILIFNSHI